MQLFHNDIFSYGRSLQEIINAEALEECRRVAGIYLNDVRSDCKVYSFGEIGINSRNFMLDNGGDMLVIKKSNAENYSRHERTCLLSNRISSQLSIVPRALAQEDRQYVNIKGAYIYSLWQYKAGNYFMGTSTQLRNAAEGIQKVDSVCRTLSEDMVDFVPSSDVNEELSMLRVFTQTSIYDSLVDDESVRFKNIYVGELLSVIGILKDCVGFSAMSGISHIDLHPHNLLYEGETLNAILDIDSFSIHDISKAYGFAAYKLYRQAVSYDKSILGMYTMRSFVHDMGLEFPFDVMVKGAFLEILRRICIILRPIMMGKTSPWIKVLAIQLRSLVELHHLLVLDNA